MPIIRVGGRRHAVSGKPKPKVSGFMFGSVEAFKRRKWIVFVDAETPGGLMGLLTLSRMVLANEFYFDKHIHFPLYAIITNNKDRVEKFFGELIDICQWNDPDIDMYPSIESAKKRIWTQAEFSIDQIRVQPQNAVVLNMTDWPTPEQFETIQMSDFELVFGTKISENVEMENLRTEIIDLNMQIADKYDTDLLYEAETRTTEEDRALKIYQAKYELTDLRPSLVCIKYLFLTGRNDVLTNSKPSTEILNIL